MVNCSDEMTIIYLTSGLNDRNLVMNLGSKQATSLNELLIRARRYIDGLEL